MANSGALIRIANDDGDVIYATSSMDAGTIVSAMLMQPEVRVIEVTRGVTPVAKNTTLVTSPVAED